VEDYFPQLLNVHTAIDVRQIEIHTAEPLVTDPTPVGAEIVITKVKNYNGQVLIKFRQN
jgi:hypothetical protein